MTDFLEIFLLIFRIYCYISISLLPITIYNSLFESKFKANSKFYRKKEWYYFLKVLWAIPAVEKYKNKFRTALINTNDEIIEKPRQITSFTKSNSQTIFGTDQKGNSIFLKIILRENRLAEVCLQLRLMDGSVYQLPDHPLILLCSIPKRQWQAGGLKIEIIKPFQTLRIIYNGLLRDQIRNDEFIEEGTVKHVYFNFIWRAGANCKYFPQDSSTNFLARAASVESWRDANWIKLLGYQTGFNQYGMLIGELKLPNSELQLRLTSSRLTRWGPSDVHVLHRGLTLFGCDENGFAFTINVKSYTKGCKELHTGDVILPNKTVYVIEDCDISLPDFFEDRIIPGAFEFSFKGGGQSYDCRAFTYLQSIADMRNEEIKGYKMKLLKIKYTINGENGSGIGLFWYKYEGRGMQKPGFIVRSGKQIVEPQKVLVASLENIECRSEYLAGTKGTQLSLLTTISDNKFKTAEGFCILAPAFSQHLEINRNIKNELNKLNDMCSGKIEGDLSEVCDNIQDLFKIQPISQFLTELISNELKIIKSTITDEIYNDSIQIWAVRCSYVNGEFDLQPTLKSQTYLDCSTIEEIIQAVILCWASTYNYKNVQYRRRKCLPIIVEMCVVVQRLINSKIAGNLFTINPDTTNPGKIVIHSNYGLGMSIVTNIVDPDKILLNRTWNDHLSVISKTIGSKLYNNILTENGLRKQENDEIDTEKLSLNDKQIIELAEIGVKLEKTLGGAKSIEWALENNNIYILNTKPIINQYNWTEFNFLHEIDTAILSQNENMIFKPNKYYFEIPALMLDQSIILENLNESLQELYGFKNNNCTLNKMNHCIGRNISQNSMYYFSKKMSLDNKIDQLVSNENLHFQKQVLNKTQNSNVFVELLDNFNYVKNAIYCCMNANDFAKEAFILSHAMKIELNENDNSQTCYKIIRRNFYILKKVFYLNECVVLGNEFYQKLSLFLMYDENEDISKDDYKNIMTKYTRTSLTEVPTKLEAIVSIMKTENLVKEFYEIEPWDGDKWLEQKCFEAYEIFQEIIQDFGHYSLNEMNLKPDTWNLHRDILIKILQKLTTKTSDRINENNKIDIDSESIEGRTKKTKGKFVNWLENKLYKSFEYRDITKLATAITINKLRNAIQIFSQKLVEESNLPNSNLIYHLDCTEIEQLLKNKNPAIVNKAVKRAEYFEKWKNYDISELCSGNSISFPTKQISTNLISYGTALNSKYVQGKACIVNNFTDLNNLNPGDILITRNLEVGLIPCFPIVSGIVTENGSFLSQAAVVARQLNIPCIIGVNHVTGLFKTDDTVLLNRKLGCVEKIVNKY